MIGMWNIMYLIRTVQKYVHINKTERNMQQYIGECVSVRGKEVGQIFSKFWDYYFLKFKKLVSESRKTRKQNKTICINFLSVMILQKLTKKYNILVNILEKSFLATWIAQKLSSF